MIDGSEVIGFFAAVFVDHPLGVLYSAVFIPAAGEEGACENEGEDDGDDQLYHIDGGCRKRRRPQDLADFLFAGEGFEILKVIFGVLDGMSAEGEECFFPFQEHGFDAV